jgi:hypothetical protein
MYQEGVQHFRYLMNVEGGLLRVTRSVPEHLSELADELAQPVGRNERNQRFVKAFVRPQGLAVPATPAFVAAVEDLAAVEPLPAEVASAWHRAAQPLMQAVARSSEEGWLRPILRDSTELTIDRARMRKSAQRSAKSAAREERVAEKRRLTDARHRERRREQLAAGRRKHLARIKGRLKALIGASS